MLAGRFVPEKGIIDAVRVLARVNASRPARLVLVGEGPMAEPARRVAASLGVGDRLSLTAWQPEAELAELYRSAHVLLIPSSATHTWVEQFGRVITEAQACGAVVAGYASGAIPEVAGDAGLLVTTGAAEELATAVVTLLADPDEWVRRRRLGRGQAAPRTWAAVADGHRALYEAVQDRPGRLTLPRSPRARRALAVSEFGAPAEALGGRRPFALPLLRRGGRLSRAVGALIDAGATARAILRPPR